LIIGIDYSTVVVFHKFLIGAYETLATLIGRPCAFIGFNMCIH